LVASADSSLVEQARRGLASVSVPCDAATTAEAVLACLESGRRNYRVVFVDLETPRLSAEDVEAIAAVMSPDAKVVRCGLVTSSGRSRGPLWLDKPCVASDFVRAMSRIGGGHA
jgi:hypothetical protein